MRGLSLNVFSAGKLQFGLSDEVEGYEAYGHRCQSPKEVFGRGKRFPPWTEPSLFTVKVLVKVSPGLTAPFQIFVPAVEPSDAVLVTVTVNGPVPVGLLLPCMILRCLLEG